jgi:2-keto-4-pentenoate hydratase/2-oxohepta-3-ene-1,7-dioic acid hydratase in catechol pathway
VSAEANPRGVRLVSIARRESPGGVALVLELAGRAFDLTEGCLRAGVVPEAVALCTCGWLEPEALDGTVDRLRLREVERPLAGESELALPVQRERVGKILALGKNFAEHASEFGEGVPEELLFFNKLPETLVPHGSTVRVAPWYAGRVDHEAELAVLIGKRGRSIEPEHALDHVAGYSVANDLTARSLQGSDRKKGHPWFRSKNMDGFCPLGPCLVPRNSLDTADLRVSARVNGTLRQDASTRDLVVDVRHAIAQLSRHLTLHPGDLILMGTPAGVGPLEDGDLVACAVDGIGELATRIARPKA